MMERKIVSTVCAYSGEATYHLRNKADNLKEYAYARVAALKYPP